MSTRFTKWFFVWYEILQWLDKESVLILITQRPVTKFNIPKTMSLVQGVSYEFCNHTATNIVEAYYESVNHKDQIIAEHIGKNGEIVITSWRQKIWIHTVHQIIQRKDIQLFKRILDLYAKYNGDMEIDESKSSWPPEHLVYHPKLPSHWKGLIFKKFPNLTYDFGHYNTQDTKWIDNVKISIPDHIYVKNKPKAIEFLKVKNLYQPYDACLACLNSQKINMKSFKQHYECLKHIATHEQLKIIDDLVKSKGIKTNPTGINKIKKK